MAAEKVTPKFTQLFINNEFVNSIDGQTFETINPATEEVIATVQRAGEKDAEAAIEAAQAAFKGEWRKLSAHSRSRLMFKLADLMEQNLEELAQLESLDNGKTVNAARMGDVPSAIKTIRYYAGLCDKVQGEVIPMDGEYFAYTKSEPVGICGQIIPWNFPIVMLAWKWGPCLASGSVSILKTSEKTPLSALRVASLVKEAGFPPGVLQILSGYGDVGAYLVKHPKIDKIAFTGSTKVGYWIQQNSSQTNLKRVTLELGGKSPLVICEDADLDLAVQIARFGFLNAGQICSSCSRVFVHENVYDKFIEKMTELAKSVKLGDPSAADTQQGPQVDEIQFKSVLGYIQKGKEEGAKCVVGGERFGEKGYFIQPTLFTDVKEDMTIYREEIFGPVVSALKFKDLEEVIEKANDTQYGLAAGIVTKSVDTYQYLANAIRAGSVYVNCYGGNGQTAPFGGFKSSGLGRELGLQGMRGYLENKTIIIKRPAGALP